MSCCRTITKQQELTQRALSCLEDTNRDDGVVTRKAVKVVATLRNILGSYHVDPRLTQRFRTDIEPGLARVWTRAQLDGYLHKVLRPFGKEVDNALGKWKRRYCHIG